MQTSPASRRRTLLLLFLLFSAVALFDAILLVKQQEPQTYQPQASTIKEGLPDARLIAADYETVGEFLDDVDPSDSDYVEILGILRNNTNTQIASATSAISDLFANAEETIDAGGQKIFKLRDADIQRTGVAIAGIVVPMTAYTETVVSFAAKTSSSLPPPIDPARRAAALARMEKLRNTDISKMTVPELQQFNQEVDLAIKEINETDTRPNVYGPLQSNKVEALRLTNEAQQMQIDALTQTLNTIQAQALTDGRSARVSDNTAKIQKLRDEIETIKKSMQTNSKKQKAALEEALQQVSTAKAPAATSQPEAEEEEGEPTITPAAGNICSKTGKKGAKNRLDCHGVAPEANCKPISNTPTNKDIENGEKYKCVKNEGASSVNTDGTEEIACDCIKKGILAAAGRGAGWVWGKKGTIGTIATTITIIEAKWHPIASLLSGGGDGGSNEPIPAKENPR